MEHTKIEWADSTWNPWRGCTKVSPGCANCYAERFSRRNPRVLGEWGSGRPRVRSKNWHDPIRWGQAWVVGTPRRRVFPSFCDWLDHEVPIHWLVDFMDLIHLTPGLDWLLLTKRPDLWRRRMQCARHTALREGVKGADGLISRWLMGIPPANVWIGVSVEDQRRADERIPELVEVPARLKFVSMEPLLEAVDLCYWVTAPLKPQFEWVIVGGESGPKSRPMQPAWVRMIRDECIAGGVPFFFKQWGGRDKSKAGRELDGRSWDEMPRLEIAVAGVEVTA